MTATKSSLLATAAFLALSVPLAGQACAESYLTPSLGYYDVVRRHDPAALFGLEYRFDEWSSKVRPIAGAFLTTDGGAYAYLGANYDVTLVPNELYLVPNFSVGGYSEGSGRQLGGPLEFRSGIELDYQLPNRNLVGIAFNHISNAGIYDHNPGEETLLINYSIPTSMIFGQ